MKRFVVYFEQVNQTRFEVTAKSKIDAVAKAVEQWKQSNASPMLKEVTELRGLSMQLKEKE